MALKQALPTAVIEGSPYLSILVGVTGHRDILPAALPAVSHAVRGSLTALKEALGASLQLITPLAEGADQLTARIARDLSIRMTVVIPMPLDRYRRTLTTPEGLSGFDELWNDPTVVQRIELPLMRGQGAQEQDSAQYEQFGLLLCRQSHILLALWNGDDPEPKDSRAGGPRRVRGGTAHVVAMRQLGDREEVSPETIRDSTLFCRATPRLEHSHGGPVLQVVTPRTDASGRGADGMESPAGTLLWWSDLPPRAPRRRARWLSNTLWPENHALTTEYLHAPRWRRLNSNELGREVPAAFHRIRSAGDQLAARAATMPRAEHGDLCPNGEPAGMRGRKPLERLQALFGSADADASDIQRRLFGTWLPGLPWQKDRKHRFGILLWFAAAVPIATLCFELFVEYGHHPVWLYAYLGAMLLPSFVYLFLVRRTQWQGRYQDHRALAEGVRVQFFWAASGIPIAVSDNYMRDQAGLLGWIRLALRGPALDGIEAALLQGSPAAFVRECWVDNQRRYFDRQKDLQEVAGAAIRRKTRAVVVTLFLLALAVFVVQLTGLKVYEPEWAREPPLVILGVLPALAAFFVIIGEGRAFEEHAHAYARAHDIFAEADRQANQLAPQEVAQWHELLLALGQEALAENAVWIQTHRARPVANRVA